MAEMKANKVTETLNPPSGGSARSIPLNKPAAWYAEAEAQQIADIVVSFQTPAGGWSKNLDLTKHQRAPGEHYASDGKSVRLTSSDNDSRAISAGIMSARLTIARRSRSCVSWPKSSALIRRRMRRNIAPLSSAEWNIFLRQNIPMAAGRRYGRWKAATMMRSHIMMTR